MPTHASSSPAGNGSPRSVQLDPCPDTAALVVDLDGTFILGSLTPIAFGHLLRHRPLVGLSRLLWLVRGWSHFKSAVGRIARPDLHALPYYQPLVDWLRAEHARGRHLVLATGSSHVLAQQIAETVGLFHAAFGCTPGDNCTGHAKLRRIRAYLGVRTFDYVGNSRVDLRVWCGARSAIVVSRSRGLATRAARLTRLSHVYTPQPGDCAPWPAAQGDDTTPGQARAPTDPPEAVTHGARPQTSARPQPGRTRNTPR